MSFLSILVCVLFICNAIVLVSGDISSLTLLESNVAPTQLYVAGEKAVIAHNGKLSTASCKQKSENNPDAFLDRNQMDFRPVFFKDNIYIVLTNQIWKVDSEGIMSQIYQTTDMLLFTSVPTHMIFNSKVLEGKTVVERLSHIESQEAQQVFQSPSKTNSFTVINNLLFISSPGAAYVFSPDNRAAILLTNYCTGSNCPNPRFFTDGGDTFYYFKTTEGVWKTDAKSTSGTSIVCSLTVCQDAIALASFGKNILLFDQKNSNMTLYTMKGNSTQEIYSFGPKNLLIDPRLRWVVSNRFFFVLTNAGCSEIWYTDGVETGLFVRPCTSSLNVTIRHIVEPRNMEAIFFQALVSNGNTSTVEIWEASKVTATSKSVSVVCSGCPVTTEYLQAITDDCLIHWSSAGLQLRYTKLQEEEDNAAALTLVSKYSLILSLVIFFISFN